MFALSPSSSPYMPRARVQHSQQISPRSLSAGPTCRKGACRFGRVCMSSLRHQALTRPYHPEVEKLPDDLTVRQVAEALEGLRFRRFKNDHRLVSLDETVRDYLVHALRCHSR